MTRRTKHAVSILILAGLVMTLLFTALPTMGRDTAAPALLWGNVSSGYSNSTGDGFRIAATAGQVDGTLPSHGDGFQITGGVWAFIEEPPPAPQPPAPPGYGLFLPVTIR